MNTQKKSKATSKDRLNGTRIFVYKDGRDGYTNISVPQAQYDELLRLAHLDKTALTNCARLVSWHGRAVEGQSWSAVVVDGMFKRLRGDHKPWVLQAALDAQAADAELAAQAAANNAAWVDTAGAVLLLAADAIKAAGEPVEA